MRKVNVTNAGRYILRKSVRSVMKAVNVIEKTDAPNDAESHFNYKLLLTLHGWYKSVRYSFFVYIFIAFLCFLSLLFEFLSIRNEHKIKSFFFLTIKKSSRKRLRKEKNNILIMENLKVPIQLN